jgi:hypothetical protein
MKTSNIRFGDSHENEHLVLIYTGTFSSFRMKEFRTFELLVKFVTRNKLHKDEFAVVTGSIIKVNPAYRDKPGDLFTDASSDELTDQALEP